MLLLPLGLRVLFLCGFVFRARTRPEGRSQRLPPFAFPVRLIFFVFVTRVDGGCDRVVVVVVAVAVAASAAASAVVNIAAGIVSVVAAGAVAVIACRFGCLWHCFLLSWLVLLSLLMLLLLMLMLMRLSLCCLVLGCVGCVGSTFCSCARRLRRSRTCTATRLSLIHI